MGGKQRGEDITKVKGESAELIQKLFLHQDNEGREMCSGFSDLETFDDFRRGAIVVKL